MIHWTHSGPGPELSWGTSWPTEARKKQGCSGPKGVERSPNNLWIEHLRHRRIQEFKKGVAAVRKGDAAWPWEGLGVKQSWRPQAQKQGFWVGSRCRKGEPDQAWHPMQPLQPLATAAALGLAQCLSQWGIVAGGSLPPSLHLFPEDPGMVSGWDGGRRLLPALAGESSLCYAVEGKCGITTPAWISPWL